MHHALTEQEKKARERVCLVLDFPSVYDSLELVRELADYVGMFKVGSILHSSAATEGFPIVRTIYRQTGKKIVLDLKFDDVPNTVYGAVYANTTSAVEMMTMHISCGEEACRKALEASATAAEKKTISHPKIIGVTELTSLGDEDILMQGMGIGYSRLVERRAEQAKNWGLDGIVCPASKGAEMEKEFGKWLYITPGIRFKDNCGEGQKQLYTPERAVKDCSSSILVIGSAITKTRDRRDTAYRILKSMADYV